ncbi:hypothetical protein HanPI659440_Chr00c09g0720791 [Helianthus annuus]|nr:hypothetical protein HanPI659440_Chr00c09g0720791 [Helianthus annuus]
MMLLRGRCSVLCVIISLNDHFGIRVGLPFTLIIDECNLCMVDYLGYWIPFDFRCAMLHWSKFVWFDLSLKLLSIVSHSPIYLICFGWFVCLHSVRYAIHCDVATCRFAIVQISYCSVGCWVNVAVEDMM